MFVDYKYKYLGYNSILCGRDDCETYRYIFYIIDDDFTEKVAINSAIAGLNTYQQIKAVASIIHKIYTEKKLPIAENLVLLLSQIPKDKLDLVVTIRWLEEDIPWFKNYSNYIKKMLIFT